MFKSLEWSNEEESIQILSEFIEKENLWVLKQQAETLYPWRKS